MDATSSARNGQHHRQSRRSKNLSKTVAPDALGSVLTASKSSDLSGQPGTPQNATARLPGPSTGNQQRSDEHRTERSEYGAESAKRSASPVVLIMEDKTPPARTGEENVAARLDRLARAKAQSQLFANWQKIYRPEESARAEKQHRCSSWVMFRAAVDSPDDWKLTRANFCQFTHTCEGCAIARGGRLLASAMSAVVGLLNQAPHLEAHFVTLTVRNGDELPETYGRLNRGLLGMMKRRRENRVHCLRRLAAGFGQIETKIGQGGGWHPHYHGVWFFETPPDYRELRECWESSVGERANGEFKLLDAERKRIDGLDRSNPEYRELLIKGLCEIIKYTCKFTPGEVESLWTAADFYRSQKTRLFRRFGSIIGIDEPADLADVCPDWDSVEYREKFFRYNEEKRVYAESQAPHECPKFQAWKEGV